MITIEIMTDDTDEIIAVFDWPNEADFLELLGNNAIWMCTPHGCHARWNGI